MKKKGKKKKKKKKKTKNIGQFSETHILQTTNPISMKFGL